MSENYSDEVMKLIAKVVFGCCDKISAVNYCRAYQFARGEEVNINLYNNVYYTIGSGKYLYPKLQKGEVLVAVCTDNGKAGMVFSLSGIYYRKDSMRCESSYTAYKDCTSISSISGLEYDEKFSKEELEKMFSAFSAIFQASALVSMQAREEFRKKINNSQDFFGEGKDEIDQINDSIQSFCDANYYERCKKLSIFQFKEKKEIEKLRDNHSAKIRSLVEARNYEGNIDDRKIALIREIIFNALNSKYFLDETFDSSYIYTEPNEISILVICQD